MPQQCCVVLWNVIVYVLSCQGALSCAICMLFHVLDLLCYVTHTRVWYTCTWDVNVLRKYRTSWNPDTFLTLFQYNAASIEIVSTFWYRVCIADTRYQYLFHSNMYAFSSVLIGRDKEMVRNNLLHFENRLFLPVTFFGKVIFLQGICRQGSVPFATSSRSGLLSRLEIVCIVS